MWASATVRGEDAQEGVLLLDALGEGQVRGLRAVGDVGVLLVLGEEELLDVVERHPEAGVHAARPLEAVLEELGVHQFADQRGGEHPDLEGADLLLHLAGDEFGRLALEEGLAHEGVDDALAAPLHHPLGGGAHEERRIGRLLGHRLPRPLNRYLLPAEHVGTPRFRKTRSLMRPPENAHIL